LGIAPRTDAAWSADPYFVNWEANADCRLCSKGEARTRLNCRVPRKAVLAGDIDDVEVLVRQGRDAET
jgi:hypothetical protein